MEGDLKIKLWDFFDTNKIIILSNLFIQGKSITGKEKSFIKNVNVSYWPSWIRPEVQLVLRLDYPLTT